MKNSIQIQKKAKEIVVKGGNSEIRRRFDTLFLAKGLKRSEVYNRLGLDKSHFAKIVNGYIIPNYALRIKIANFLGVDSSVIWSEIQFETAYNHLKNQENENENYQK